MVAGDPTPIQIGDVQTENTREISQHNTALTTTQQGVTSSAAGKQIDVTTSSDSVALNYQDHALSNESLESISETSQQSSFIANDILSQTELNENDKQSKVMKPMANSSQPTKQQPHIIRHHAAQTLQLLSSSTSSQRLKTNLTQASIITPSLKSNLTSTVTNVSVPSPKSSGPLNLTTRDDTQVLLPIVNSSSIEGECDDNPGTGKLKPHFQLS